MPIVRIDSNVHASLSLVSSQLKLKPYRIASYLFEEHYHIVDKKAHPYIRAIQSNREALYLPTEVSKVAYKILEAYARSFDTPIAPIATYILQEHLVALTLSPEAYPGLYIPSTDEGESLRRPGQTRRLASYSAPKRSAGLYRELYLFLKIQSIKLKVEDPTIGGPRELAFQIFTSVQNSVANLLQLAKTQEFQKFLLCYRPQPCIPVILPTDLDWALDTLKRDYLIPKTRMCSFFVWRHFRLEGVELTHEETPPVINLQSAAAYYSLLFVDALESANEPPLADPVPLPALNDDPELMQKIQAVADLEPDTYGPLQRVE